MSEKKLIRKYAGRSLKSQKILCCRRRDKKKIYRIWRRYIMSRSYKHTPVYKGDKYLFRTYAKRIESTAEEWKSSVK